MKYLYVVGLVVALVYSLMSDLRWWVVLGLFMLGLFALGKYLLYLHEIN